MDLSAFFFEPLTDAQVDAAKAVCGQCPVRVSCLLNAIRFESNTRNPSWGIFGGLTPRERRKFIRERSLVS